MKILPILILVAFAFIALPLIHAYPLPNNVPGNWVLVLTDNFSGTQLNNTKWIPNWNWKWGGTNSIPTNALGNYYVGSDSTCFAPIQVQVSNGLILEANTVSNVIGGCGTLVSKSYASGTATTFNTFNFTYGLYQVNALITGTSTNAYNIPAIWATSSVGTVPVPYSNFAQWPYTGEIDIIDPFAGGLFHGGYLSQCTPSGTGFDSGSLMFSGYNTGYYTYAVDWEPNSLTYYYNGIQVAQFIGGTNTLCIPKSPEFLISSYNLNSLSNPVTIPQNMKISSISVWQHNALCSGPACDPTVYLNTTSISPWIVPNGVTSLTVNAVGGGGGTPNVITFSVIPGNSIQFSVGAGSGQSTWFGGNSFSTAKVGSAGAGSSANGLITINYISDPELSATLTISNSIIDIGQTEAVTANEYNGLSAFTYNIILANAVAPTSIVRNSLITNTILTSETSTFIFGNVGYQNSPLLPTVSITDNTPSTAYASASNIIVNLALTNPSFANIITSTPINFPSGVAISPSGTYVYVTQKVSNTIAILNAANLIQIGTITGFNTPDTVAFAPNGQYAYVPEDGNMVAIVSTATNTIVSNIIGFNTPITVAFSPDGSYAYVVNNGNYITGQGYLSIVSTATNTIVGNIIGFAPAPGGVSIAPNGQYAYVTNDAGAGTSIAYVSTATNSIVANIVGLAGPNKVEIAPNGLYAYVGSGTTDQLQILSTVTNTVIGNVVNFGGLPGSISFAPNGLSALVASFTINQLYLINIPLTISPSKIHTVAAGNVISFTSEVGGGTSPYTYKWDVFNSVTNVLLNTTIYTSVAYQSNTFAFTANSNLGGNTIYANVLITDSATTPESYNSIESGVQTIMAGVPPLAANAITPNNPTIISGGNVILTSSPSGGNTPYTYMWYASTSGSPVCNSGDIIAGSNSNINVFPTSNTYYTYLVTDNSLNIACSPSDLVTVTATYTPLSLISWTASNSPVDIGQYQTLIATVSNGLQPYTYNFLVYNNIGSLVENQLVTGVYSTSNTFTFELPGGQTTGIWTANIIVIDSNTMPTTVTNSITFTTSNAAALNVVISPGSQTVYAGQSVTFTATPSGGVSPYSYQWYAGNFLSCSSNPSVPGATSSTFSATPPSNTYYCVNIHDSNIPSNSVYSVTSLLTVSGCISQASQILIPISQNFLNIIPFLGIIFVIATVGLVFTLFKANEANELSAEGLAGNPTLMAIIGILLAILIILFIVMMAFIIGNAGYGFC